MLAVAFDMKPRGVLPGSITELSALLGKSPQDVMPHLAELECRRVFSRGREVKTDLNPANWDMSELSDDCIVSRRMYREWKLRCIRAAAGSKGGIAKSSKSDSKKQDTNPLLPTHSNEFIEAKALANAEQIPNSNSNSNYRPIDLERGCGGKQKNKDRTNSKPEGLGEIFAAMGGLSDPTEELVGRVIRITGEPKWKEWWTEVLDAITHRGGKALSATMEAIDHCENAVDPVKRKTKDVGAYRNGVNGARGDLVRKVTRIMKANRLYWPTFPDKAKSA